MQLHEKNVYIPEICRQNSIGSSLQFYKYFFQTLQHIFNVHVQIRPYALYISLHLFDIMFFIWVFTFLLPALQLKHVPTSMERGHF